MSRFLYTLTMFILMANGFTLALFEHNDASDGLRDRLHNHTLLHSSSSPVLNPELKTAAKVAACSSIGKGVCLGVTAAKYADTKLTEQ